MSIFLTPIFKVGDDFILLSCIYDLSSAEQNIGFLQSCGFIFKVAILSSARQKDLLLTQQNHGRICLEPQKDLPRTTDCFDLRSNPLFFFREVLEKGVFFR